MPPLSEYETFVMGGFSHTPFPPTPPLSLYSLTRVLYLFEVTAIKTCHCLIQPHRRLDPFVFVPS